MPKPNMVRPTKLFMRVTVGLGVLLECIHNTTAKCIDSAMLCDNITKTPL